jgi:hypothetical protein
MPVPVVLALRERVGTDRLDAITAHGPAQARILAPHRVKM